MSETVTRLPRVGILIPSTDTTVEIEMPQRLAGVATCHFARMSLSEVTEEGLRAMEAEALKAAAVLRDVNPDLLLYACTSGTFVLGAEHEAELVRQLSEIVGCPVLTTAQALIEATQHHGTVVRLRTPYSDEVTRAEVGYFEGFGFVLSSSKWLGRTEDDEIAAVEESELIEFVQGNDTVDCCVLSCTNLRTLEIEEQLFESAGVPVLTSNRSLAELVLSTLNLEGEQK